MKKSLVMVVRLSFLAIAFTLLVAGTTQTMAQIIPSDRVVPWVPGVTVGVRGGIPAPRTNLIDVTKSPYNANNTGSSDASSAIQSAINAASNGQVVYLPAGVYDIRSGITVNKDSITLRGAGANTVLVGTIAVSQDPNGNYPQGYGIGIASGAVAGATSIVLYSNVDEWGSVISAGDTFSVSSLITGNSNFQYIVSGGGDSVATSARSLKQPILVTNVSGNTIYFTPPLVWNFTNGGLLVPMNLVGLQQLRMRQGLGFEDFTLTASNGILMTSPAFMFKMEMCHDSWVTNCEFDWGANYNVYFEYCIHCAFAHNGIRHSQGGGSNHAGLLAANDSGCLLEDNIISDGLQPGLEWNDGFCGNAIFANVFTNNIIDLDMHNTHPVMNLWEENVTGGFELDGYFGSCSHQTLLRDRIYNTVALKRWSTYIQVVGCVLGNSGYPYIYSPTNSNYSTYGVLELGYPNIGNSTFDNISPQVPWNYPGNKLTGFWGENVTNGIFVFTNNQVNTNILWGNFINVPSQNSSLYSLVGQDPVNTNIYHLIGSPASAPTPSNITMSAAVTVSNGWRVFIADQNAYQWRQASNVLTDVISGNAVYTNSIPIPAMMWDANGVQTIPVSLLYTNGAPVWWGSTPWPAIDPISSTVAMIPAQARYLGIQTQPAPQLLAPPTQLKATGAQ